MKTIIQSLASSTKSQLSNNPSYVTRWIFLILTIFANLFSLHGQITPVINPSGGFHIDGNLISNTPTSGIGDWVSGSGTGGFVFNNDGSSVNPLRSQLFIDAYDSNTDLTFQSGKYNDNPNTWSWSASKASGKNDINNVMYHMATDLSNDMWIILGADRLTTTGSSYIDFEFLQHSLSRNASFGFTSAGPHGGRTINDILISVEYNNGGSVATVRFYLWKPFGTGYKYIEQTIPSSTAFAITNSSTVSVPFGAFGNTSYNPYQFVETAVNITDLFGSFDPCLSLTVNSVIVKTKASASESASLGDFIEPIQVSFKLGDASISYPNGLCQTGVANVNQSGVTGGVYSASPAGLSINSSTGQINLASSQVGTYIVTYSFTTNGCPKSTTTSITINALPVAPTSALSSNASVCFGYQGNIVLSANGGTGTTLKWHTGGCNGTLIGTGNNLSIAAPSSTTTYYVAWENSCGISSCAQVTVVVLPQLSATATGSAQVSCFNAANGQITVNAIGGTGTYSYSLNGGTAQTSNIFSGLVAGTYSIEVFDANNCSVTTSAITIANPTQLSATATGSAQVSCFNAADGQITVSATGGTGAYTYSLNGGVAQTSNNFSGLVAGTYSIEVFDANNCSVTTSAITIANPTQLSAIATGSAQVSCFNAADGQITVSATGGTGAYSYSLNGGTSQTSNIFSGLVAGTYSIEVFDANNCSVTTSAITIANPAQLSATASGSAQVSCFNTADGQITVNATGGTGAYTYSLNGGTAQTSNIFSGLVAGTYSIKVFDANNCSVTTSSITIANPTQLSATATGSAQVSCFNAANGQITVNTTGGTGAYTYSLNGGVAQTSNIFSGLVAGTYSIEVFDANNCSVTTSAITIANPTQLSATASGSVQVSCYNAADGQITVNAIGGTGTYSYSLNGGTVQTSNIFSGLVAGTYSIEVFDANNCSVTTSAISIANPTQLSATATGSAQVSCFNAADGQITVSATGGTGAYTYSINGGIAQTSNLFSGLVAGTYSIEVFDANNCSVTTSAFTIANPTQLSATASGSVQVSCFNAADGQITVNATGGTGAYTYSLNGGVAQTSNNFSGLVAGTYSIEVFDANNCSVTTSAITIANPTQLSATATGSAQVSCFNAADGQITVSATGGTGAYTYSLNGGVAQTSNLFSGLVAGTYSIEVFDANNCSVTTSAITIANPTQLSATATGSAQVSCYNAADGQITVSATGGTGAYTYSLNGGVAQTSNNFSGLVAGTYSIEVFDANNCSVTTSAITIANPTQLSATATGSAQVSCFNSADGQITVNATGGTGAYSYSLNGGTVQTSNNFSGLVAGTYSIEVFDANNCSVTTSAITIANPTQLSATATGSVQVSCFNAADGQITVNATGGTGTYSYSLNGGTAQTSNIFSGLVAGTYSIEVFDANNCSVTTSAITIANPTQLSATASGSAQVSCFNAADGQITVNATGGTGTYTYSLNGGVAQTSNIFSGLVAGTYSIEVFDANNCSVTTSAITIANPTQLSATATGSVQVSCFNAADGQITVSATGGTGAYTYSLNGGVAQTSNLFLGLVAGTYSIEVFDANNCSVTTSAITIANPAQLSATATGSAQVSCFNAADGQITVIATGGTGTYSYSLNGGTAQTSNIFSGLVAGTYSIEVFDANNCSVTTSAITIANSTQLSATAAGSVQVSCFNAADGQITVNATGGTGAYTYSLNGGVAQTSNLFSGLVAGTYSIEVFDANNCSVTTSAITIANPAQLSATATGSAQVSCFNAADGQITVSATGGTGAYTYSLNGGVAQTSNLFSGLVAGTYSIEVFDANNCSVTTSAITIANPTQLSATASGSAQVSCFNAADGQITVNATGGTGAYSYSLNGGTVQTSNIFSGLVAGTYSIEVFDANNCSVTTSAITIANPTQLSATATGSAQVSCFNSADGQIIVNATGGTGAYTYSLNGGVAQTSNIFSGLVAGTYSIEVFDGNNCSVTTSAITIANPTQLSATATGSAQVSCFNAANGQIIVNATGGTGTFTYSLNGATAQTSNSFTGLTAGTYTIKVFDANNCSVTTSAITIANPVMLEAEVTVTSDISCHESSDGIITVSVFGGTPPYLYSLDGGASQLSNIFTNVSSGTHQVKITDNMECTISKEVTLNSKAPVSYTHQAFCRGGIPGVIITANGGTAPYQYSIDGGLTYSSDNKFDTTIVGSHIYLTVKDANQCSSAITEVEVRSLNTLRATANVLSQNSCYGINDASAEVVITGGVPPYNTSLNMGAVSNNVLFNGLAPGEYQVEVRDSNTCPASATFVIEAKEPIIINLLSKNDIDCSGTNGGSAQLAVSGGEAPYSYNWSNGNNGVIGANLSAGINTVTVTDANQCETSYQILISMSQPNNELEFKNVFSPNNDGINDTWVIKNLEYYPENELVIINRWGNEVYTQKSYTNNWDGTQLSEGTYFYVLNVQMCNETKKFTGYITIVR